MSEATRARRQRAINLREELREKLGADGIPEPPPLEAPADLDPSWGPLGSLARACLSPSEYAHLMALHDNMLRRRGARGAADGVEDMTSEVQPAPVEPIEPEPPQPKPRRRRKVEEPIVDLGSR